MLRILALAAFFACFAGAYAMAACPSEVPGSSIEAIKANEQRVLCLLREVEQAAQQRKYEADLQALERRVDALPRFAAPEPFTPPVFAGPNNL